MKKIAAVAVCFALALLSTVTVFASPGEPTLSVGEVTAQPDTSVEVPLTISDNSGICGATLSVSYDSALTLTEVKKGTAFSGLEMTEPGNLTANPVRILWYSAKADASNGDIATLVFTAPSDAGKYPVIVTYEAGDIVDTNLKSVDFTINNGSVTVEDNRTETEQVNDLIDELNSLDSTNTKKVAELRRIYNALSDAQKAQIPQDALKKLTDAEAAIQKTEDKKQENLQIVAPVINTINDIDPNNEDSVAAARAAYNALTDDQKALISKDVLDNLTNAEVSIANAKEEAQRAAENKSKADDVADLIKALPSDPTSEDQSVVKTAREAYENLTEDQKKLIDEDTLSKLKSIEEKVQQATDSKNFAIESLNIVLSEQSYVYDGTEKTPAISIKNKDYELKQNEDYELSYKNNVEVGTATVTVTGKGDYTGSKELTFQIVKADEKPETKPEPELETQPETKPAPASVEKSQNTITAKDTVFRTYNKKKDQSFNLGAKANGAPLSYKSNNKKVMVKNGKVTVKKGFMGQVTITVTAAETDGYLSAEKKVTVMVGPSASKISSVKWDKKKKVVNVSWKKNSTGKGYEVQYSTDKSFKKSVKTVKIKKNATVKAAIKKLKKGTYYVRIRTINGKTYSDWSKNKTVKIK